MVLDSGAEAQQHDGCSLFRDSADVEPPEGTYAEVKDTLNNNYEKHMPAPVYKHMPKDEWVPDPAEECDDDMAKVKSAAELTAGQKLLKKIRSVYPKILELVDSGPVLGVFMIMTLWALLAFDILFATTSSPRLDTDFAWVSLVFMVLFFVELCVRSITQPEYCLVEYSERWKGPGFFFVLDLLATATMYQDVLPAFEDRRDDFQTAATIEEDNTDIASARQSLETGTRVGRMLRLIRVVRVVKVISILGKRNKEQASEELKPSAVGKRLNELIIQKVILTVGVITLLAPYLSMGDLSGQGAQGVGLELLVYGSHSGGIDAYGGNYSKMVYDYEARMFNNTRAKLVFLDIEKTRWIPQLGTSFDSCGTVPEDPACLLPRSQCSCPASISDVRSAYLSLLQFNNSRAWFDVSETEQGTTVLSN